MPYKNSFITLAPDSRSWVVGFGGDTGFLCNFSPEPVFYEGIQYPTSEHAFAATKTLDVEKKQWIARQRGPGNAKHAGRQVVLRPDWNQVRVREMYQIVKAKFDQHSHLMQRLIALHGCWLMEGNTWDDQVWGCTQMTDGTWVGQNNLGKVLMTVRDEELVRMARSARFSGWKTWGKPPWVETEQPSAGKDSFWDQLST